MRTGRAEKVREGEEKGVWSIKPCRVEKSIEAAKLGGGGKLSQSWSTQKKIAALYNKKSVKRRRQAVRQTGECSEIPEVELWQTQQQSAAALHPKKQLESPRVSIDEDTQETPESSVVPAVQHPPPPPPPSPRHLLAMSRNSMRSWDSSG